MAKPRILALGEVLTPSGYARVLQGLLPFLAERFEVHVFSRGYAGPPVTGRWDVHPNLDPLDVWGIEQVPALVERLQPDLVWVVYDAALYLVHKRALTERPTVLYCPIDGPDPDPDHLAGLSSLARLVLFTPGSREIVSGALPDLPPIDVLPHGVDTALFRPLGDRTALRRRLFGIDTGFMVLNANRNNRRKRPDLTIEGFARFAATRPDAYLCLHMDPLDHYDLRALARQAGIESRVIFSETELTSEQLNQLYNACDVGVNTSAGEGWGLVSFEHAATGAAQVVPRHSACAELWANAGVLLEPAASSRAPMALCENQDVTADGLAGALARLYDDEAYRRERGDRAYQLALDPRYRWDTIARGWDDLFTSLAGRPSVV